MLNSPDGSASGQYHHSESEAKGSWRPLKPNQRVFVGIDVARGDDHTAYTVIRTPGKIRQLFRRLGLDKSRWEYKVIDQGIISKEASA